MGVLADLTEIWKESEEPFLRHKDGEVKFDDVINQSPLNLESLRTGDVVAVIGDFNPETILTLLRLIDLKMIVVPLTHETHLDHEYFFETACVDAVVSNNNVSLREHGKSHELISRLRESQHGGLVLFSTGTTGRPKAILHDMENFLKRFKTPRPALRTLSFLLFDHIGGLNTLFHTLYNKGVIVAPTERSVESIFGTCDEMHVEVLPTTPTFLRMVLLSGLSPESMPDSLKIITYGTELMDQPTLIQLCALFPKIDFRQTYGMSELGIMRVKSEARDSLYMSIGGEGIETRIIDNVLQIRAQSRMLGYLNAPSPFDSEGWYDTKDVVTVKEGLIMVTGRTGDAINVGGLKFMASEVERVALSFEGVAFVKVFTKPNPLSGQHVELTVQPAVKDNFQLEEFREFLKLKLRPHMVPRRIKVEDVEIGLRFKRK
jgi:long-chain acyl-CoA synthetase